MLSAKRDIAQSGSAPALGAGCREFESLYPDQFFVVDVAQLVEPRIVIPVVAGSNPVIHPIFPLYSLSFYFIFF